MCTYNRSADLRELLESVRGQDTGGLFECEVVVVNNNSTDDTERIVQDAIASGGIRIRYLFEPRQGLAYALNTALRAASGAVCAKIDDDLILPAGYLRTLWNTFQAHPEVSIIGGRVLPIWGCPSPQWLTPKHWAPVALADYGDAPFYAGEGRPGFLLAAGFRKEDLLSTGQYDVRLGVSKGAIGGVEDSEIYNRMYAIGYRGWYEPSLKLFHKVEPHRTTKAYHRRWHFGHGRQLARAGEFSCDGSRFVFLGVPAYIYRMMVREFLVWSARILQWDFDGAFERELAMRTLAGAWLEDRRARSKA